MSPSPVQCPPCAGQGQFYRYQEGGLRTCRHDRPCFAMRPPPEPLTRTSGSYAPVGVTPGTDQRRGARFPVHALKFKFILFILSLSLPYHLASSQHQTTHCPPGLPTHAHNLTLHRTQDQMRTCYNPIPHLTSPFLTVPFPFISSSSFSDFVNQRSHRRTAFVRPLLHLV